MVNEKLILDALCAGLPHKLMIYTEGDFGSSNPKELYSIEECGYWMVNGQYKLYKVKPYLRPLTSMTDEEAKEFDTISETITIVNYQQVTPSHYDCMIEIADIKKVSDWFAKKHFDTAGLIEKGLAVEAPEGMYKNEQL